MKRKTYSWRVRLMSQLRHVARVKPQREAAKRLGVSLPRLNDLLCGKISKFRLGALVNVLSHAGMRFELKKKAGSSRLCIKNRLAL
jgi:predicted XRE-type DNA-binding protein